MPSSDDSENPELVDFKHHFWWILPLSVIVFALAMFRHSLLDGGIAHQSWIEFAPSTRVVLWAGWPFFVRWAQSIGDRSPNMWPQIGTGVGAAYGFSVVTTLAHGIFFRRHLPTMALLVFISKRLP